MTLRHNALIFWLIVLVTLAADQASKMVVRARFAEGQTLPLIPDVFHLTHVQNMGAGFGIFPGYQPVFVATTALVLVAIAAYWKRSRPKEPLIVIALGLITSGAIGNGIDRLWRGSVTDFFDFTLIDFPVFNIADSALVIGVGILIGWLLFVPEPASEAVDADLHVASTDESDAEEPGAPTP